jgi:hypothetical protein
MHRMAKVAHNTHGGIHTPAVKTQDSRIGIITVSIVVAVKYL